MYLFAKYNLLLAVIIYLLREIMNNLIDTKGLRMLTANYIHNIDKGLFTHIRILLLVSVGCS